MDYEEERGGGRGGFGGEELDVDFLGVVEILWFVSTDV